ncbi:hypothetical protein RKD33_000004 [Streptomyces sp. SAI-129]
MRDAAAGDHRFDAQGPDETAVGSCRRQLARREPTSAASGCTTLPHQGRSTGPQSGPSPVDRARPGSKHHLIVDGQGIPLTVSPTGGNRNHVTQLVPLLKTIPSVAGLVGLMRLVESPHPVLMGSPDLLTLFPHPPRADLRTDATWEGPPDSQPGPGAGRAVQGGRSPARSAAEGALDRSARPAHCTVGRTRPSLPAATDWGTKSSTGRFPRSSSGRPRNRRDSLLGDRGYDHDTGTVVTLAGTPGWSAWYVDAATLPPVAPTKGEPWSTTVTLYNAAGHKLVGGGLDQTGHLQMLYGSDVRWLTRSEPRRRSRSRLKRLSGGGGAGARGLWGGAG